MLRPVKRPSDSSEPREIETVFLNDIEAGERQSSTTPSSLDASIRRRENSFSDLYREPCRRYFGGDRDVSRFRSRSGDSRKSMEEDLRFNCPRRISTTIFPKFRREIKSPCESTLPGSLPTHNHPPPKNSEQSEEINRALGSPSVIPYPRNRQCRTAAGRLARINRERRRGAATCVERPRRSKGGSEISKKFTRRARLGQAFLKGSRDQVGRWG